MPVSGKDVRVRSTSGQPRCVPTQVLPCGTVPGSLSSSGPPFAPETNGTYKDVLALPEEGPLTAGVERLAVSCYDDSVFPDLNRGKNTYKAVQRSAGTVAIGLVLQGLNRPANDLSRGCTVTDIVNTVAITAIQAQSIKGAS